MSMDGSLSRRNFRNKVAPVGQKNGAIACSKKGCLLTRRGDSDGAGVGAESAIVQFRKFANAAANARSDGQGPEDAPLAKLYISLAACGLEVFDVVPGGSRKEKKLVKITLARQLCFARRQIRVLRQLAGRKGAQRDDGHSGFGRQGFQGFRSCGLPLGDRQASEPAQAYGRRIARPGRGSLGPQVEIAFGKEYSGAILGDKRVGVRELAARRIRLKAGAAGEPDCGNAAVIKGGGEFVETRHTLSVSGYQVVNGEVQDERSLMQTVLRSASFHLSGVC